MNKKWKIPISLKLWLDIPKNAERRNLAIIKNNQFREERKEAKILWTFCFLESSPTYAGEN